MKNSTKMEKQDARKQLIVDAAISCFIEKGYNQTGVRDIASAAGVSLGNLYNYFKGKEAIIEQIAAFEATELEPFVTLLTNRDDIEKTLDTFVQSYFKYACMPENSLLGIEIIGEAVRNPKIADVFENNRSELISALSDLLVSGKNVGIFRKFDCTKEAAKLVLELIESRALRLNFTTSNTEVGAKIEFTQFIKAALKPRPKLDN